MSKRTMKATGTLFEGRPGLMFATNRANVLPILSSGLIRPRAAYEKYYTDLLAYCPGLIPLWPNGVPKSVIPLLSSEEPGMFPLLVELDPQLVEAPPQAMLTIDCRAVDEGAHVAGADALCHLMGAPIPFAAVKCLHFANHGDLEDFAARDFDNVLALPPLQVTPALFTADGPELTQLTTALQAVNFPAAVHQDFRRIDAAMGAVAMLALLLPPSTDWLQALAASVSFPQAQRPRQEMLPSWASVLVSLIMSPRSRDDVTCTVDVRLMHAAIDLLTSLSPRDGWVEVNIIGELAARASVGANPTEAKEIDSWRDVVTAVARNDKQAGALDDTGSIVRRALMLLVLRCTPERIAVASKSRLNPGPQVTAVAGMLSGLFHGYSRISRQLKTQRCSPEVLSRLAICWWPTSDPRSRKLAIETPALRVDPVTVRIELTVDRSTLTTAVFHPDDSMMRLFYQAKNIGYALEYDPARRAFVLDAGSESTKARQVLIELGRPTARGQDTIRLRTACRTANGKPARPRKREDYIALLERNHDPSTQCVFAVDPKSGNIELLAHQMLETMDSPELHAHIDAIVAMADEFETRWGQQSITDVPRSTKSSTQTRGSGDVEQE